MPCWPIWSLRFNSDLARWFLGLFLQNLGRPSQGNQADGDTIGTVHDALQEEEN